MKKRRCRICGKFMEFAMHEVEGKFRKHWLCECGAVEMHRRGKTITMQFPKEIKPGVDYEAYCWEKEKEEGGEDGGEQNGKGE